MKLRVLERIKTEIIDGNEMTFIPKFYYRGNSNCISETSSYCPNEKQPGRIADYGARVSFDISPEKRLGYTLYPAFNNCKNGFWISSHKISLDKNGAMQSKAGEIATTNISYEDAVRNAKAFGPGYVLPDFYKYQAVMILSLLAKKGVPPMGFCDQVSYPTNISRAGVSNYPDDLLVKKSDFPKDSEALYLKTYSQILGMSDFGTGPSEWIYDAWKNDLAVTCDSTLPVSSSLTPRPSMYGMSMSTKNGGTTLTPILTTGIGWTKDVKANSNEEISFPAILPYIESSPTATIHTYNLGSAVWFVNDDKNGGTFPAHFKDTTTAHSKTIFNRLIVGGSLPFVYQQNNTSYYKRFDVADYVHSPFNLSSVVGYDDDEYDFIGFRVAKED